jgi:hypothetical protein
MEIEVKDVMPPEPAKEEFAIVFKGEKAKLIDKFAKLWDKDREETVGLACALLQMHSKAKMENKKVCLMDADGVFTFVELT